ncbi:outer membrane beta-barrel protein [Zobellia galactanivorans]|uniref:Conserved hypothetical periplasmic protein n=1 Tax=Zobellia galactanivorans (strain DSM 12802 / CCUG 47099 / CIP 106680 / NCIMB 13871 / Dsij) TaxID=63186 RepID=G0LB98_ZOBGA|nr:outer membrane beta-barrel protein [Zobellia galactanivorans]MBU3026603.1 porin family protein [Zobellia galactanivorans]MDO6809255.1 outer membrane beta-barrel protein [Zobellia galactanivorans]CAZ95894.1 Conserved hypothetical periplasmic protein [Zobellia galactanivorans]
MKKIYFLSVLIFFLGASLFAQDYKWSVEANYPLSIGDELGNDAPGIIDLGIKYRFLDLSIVKIGAGINTGVFKENINDQVSPANMDFDETNWLIQPKIFAEFNIPVIKKLHPSIGLGYAIIESKYDGLVSGQPYENTVSSGGFNLNLGLSYDITDRFFLQAQYDYINDKDTYDYDGSNVGVDYNRGYLKFGVGFRF